MDFRYYFLKEGSRTYEKTDLMTFLRDTQNIQVEQEPNNKGNIVFNYHHDILNFDAKFVMAKSSQVPNLDRLDPKYFDVNFYVEFDVTLSNYAVEILLDIIEEICKKFRFLVYVYPPASVYSFRRPDLIRYFSAVKKAYSDRYPEKLQNYNRLDPQTLSQVYSYLQKRKKLELSLKDQNVVVSNYIFLKTEKSRTAYVAIEWNGEDQFIVPPSVEIIKLDDGKVSRYIPMDEVYSKAEKMFRAIDGLGAIKIVDAKFTKKLHKILTKEHFPAPNSIFSRVSLDQILDV